MSRFTKERQAEITAKRLATRAQRANEKKGKAKRYAKKAHYNETFSHSSFLFGRIVRDIEYYAASQGIPVAPLASEVADLLRHQAGR